MLNNTLVLHKGDTVYMDGKLELKNRYSLIRVIYHSMGDNYIPYIVGCIIEGPKGGSYMPDNFGLGHLFRYFDLTTKQGTQCLVYDKNNNLKIHSRQIVRDKDIVKGKTNEECARYYANTHGYKYIKRTEALNFIDKIRK